MKDQRQHVTVHAASLAAKVYPESLGQGGVKV
jgi:hypothetical protein